MREMRILLGLEFRSLFGINRLRHTRDKKQKSRGRLLAGVWIFLLLMVTGYIAGFSAGLILLGFADLVPLYLAIISCLLVFFFGLFKAGGTLFGQAGYELLVAMPLSPRAVILIRLIRLYIEDFLCTVGIFLPGLVTWGILCRPPVSAYPLALVGCLLLPLVPLVASALISTLIYAVSARMKHKTLIQSLLLVAFAVALILLSFCLTDTAGTLDENFLADLLGRASGLLGRLWPPARWLSDAMHGVSYGGLGLLALLSVGTAGVGMGICIALFPRIMRGLGSVRARHDFRFGEMASGGLLAALYKREMRRYFASSVYVSNTIIGPILAVILAVTLCVTGVEGVMSALSVALPVETLLPFLLTLVLCMLPPAAVAVSMEGKQIETIQSLPIPAQTWLWSKLLVSATFLLPAWVVSEVLLTITLRPDPLTFAAQVLAPLSLIAFSLVFGLSFNLKFHSFDWERDEVPVKQSLAAFGGFAGPIATLISGGLVACVPAPYAPAVALAVALALALITVLLARPYRRVRMEAL